MPISSQFTFGHIKLTGEDLEMPTNCLMVEAEESDKEGSDNELVSVRPASKPSGTTSRFLTDGNQSRIL